MKSDLTDTLELPHKDFLVHMKNQSSVSIGIFTSIEADEQELC